MNIKIGVKIKSLRTRDGVTQEKLASALGVTAQAVSKWESENGYPDLEYLTPIANFFNVTLDELFDHDLVEKQRKIDEYCAKYDELFRNWSPSEERVELMRQALAEFPANESFLYRLAMALWYQWDGKRFHCYGDHEKTRAVHGWEEPVKIMEDILAVSVNDEIRSECTRTLATIYASIGEKEKAIELAGHYPESKNTILCIAFRYNYYDEYIMYSQKLIIDGLYNLTYQLPRRADDRKTKIAAVEKLIDLYKFIFRGDYGFYNTYLFSLYDEYAELLTEDDQIDKAFEMLENAFEYAKAFDVYLERLRKEGKAGYSSPFTNKIMDESESVYATKNVPGFLNCVLKDKTEIYYKKMSGDPRYDDLVSRVEKEITEKQ